MKELQELSSQTQIMSTFQSEPGTFPSLKHPRPSSLRHYRGDFDFFLIRGGFFFFCVCVLFDEHEDKKRADVIAPI